MLGQSRAASIRTLCAMFILALCASTSAAARDEIKISFQRSSTLLILLKRSGTLEKRLAPLGFDVSWNDMSAGMGSTITSGSVELHGDVADAATVFPQAANAPITFYAREVSAPTAQAIIVHEDSPIKTVADLKGKRVGVSKGSGTHYLLTAALRKAGMTLDDIDVRYLPAPDGLTAFTTNRLDAWVTWDPYLSTQQLQSHVRVIADGSDGLALYSRYYMATTGFAQAHPEVLKIVFDALAETGKWVKANPKEAARLLGPLWGGVPEDSVELANSRRSYAIVAVPDPAADAELQHIADTFYQAKLIPRKIDTASIKVWTPPVPPQAAN
jgi:sulfonate transport system substrate-binding protein